MSASAVAPVSVVIPCYRSGDTVGRAVRSVMAQTRPVHEVILVDDGSGDGTADVLHALAREHGQRVRVVVMPQNRGVAVARNTGWEAATQPWIALLDSDDTWHPRKIELQMDWLAAHPDVVLCSHQRVLTNSESHPPVDSVGRARRISKRRILVSNRFATSSVLLRRDLPFRFDPDKRHSEDYLLWLRIVLSGHEGWELDAPLSYMYKEVFGASGISGPLWRTEKMELESYNRIRREGLISPATQLALLPLSLAKFARRLAVRQLRG